MAAIAAGRILRRSGGGRVVALDSARTLGAKVLVSGGGRCNVTHDHVDERAYAGGSKNTIRTVLRRFGVADTVAFFRDLGVELTREPTGKLFPTTDTARTILDALLSAARDAGVELRHPALVASVELVADRGDSPTFALHTDQGTLTADRVILATGGRSLPKTGSDGHGYAIARALGHTTTPQILPTLVPLTLDAACPLRALSGLTLPVRIELHSGTSRRVVSFSDSTLCTHFGLSGPAIMDISRHYLLERAADPGAHLVANFLPDADREALEHELVGLGPRRIAAWLRDKLPERLADVLCDHAGIGRNTTGATLRKDARRRLIDAVFRFHLPVTGSRGFTHAEVTAGGVMLDEIDPATMASRRCHGLFFCGEILDVDGRIGGFNFQWAWATGHLAGLGAARSLAAD
ncbi:MAG: aminoacetone oxidase family FAD-binding enzyme [Phycisphaeraceae bacterium]|nr:MAG: aminoacetone oxidase family FAD-binding enzyme [Phycisphaeraceae bacterium]